MMTDFQKFIIFFIYVNASFFLIQNMTADKIKISQSPDMGLEPMTLRLKVWCSTDWANRAAHTRFLFIDQVKLAYKFNFVFVTFQVFDGNTDRHSIVYHQFLRPFTAINVRFYPRSWYSWISMRAEVYGCSGIVELNQNLETMELPKSQK